MTQVDQRFAREIARNVAIHDRIARQYDAVHGEIFNEVEQARLHEALKSALDLVRTTSKPVAALDFGCGSGNITRHLLDLGAHVTAADVSQGFLDLVRTRYPTGRLTTVWMNDGDASGLADASFDFVATYSVLHHIPDYLGAVREMARVCRPGGLIMIDHEPSEGFWTGDPTYDEFRRAALKTDWRKYFTPANYLHRVRRWFEPRYSNEGDIHVWPDDHIEWPKVTARLVALGFEIVRVQDYLLSRRLYRTDVFDRYRTRCSDMRMMVFRKCAV